MRKWVGTVTSAAWIALAATTGCGEAPQRADADPPAATARTTQASVQIIALSGANPNENDALIEHYVDSLVAEDFRVALAAEADVAPDEIDLAVCRPGASAILEVSVRHPDREAAEHLIEDVDADAERNPCEGDSSTMTTLEG